MISTFLIEIVLVGILMIAAIGLLVVAGLPGLRTLRARWVRRHQAPSALASYDEPDPDH